MRCPILYCTRFVWFFFSSRQCQLYISHHFTVWIEITRTIWPYWLQSIQAIFNNQCNLIDWLIATTSSEREGGNKSKFQTISPILSLWVRRSFERICFLRRSCASITSGQNFNLSTFGAKTCVAGDEANGHLCPSRWYQIPFSCKSTTSKTFWDYPPSSQTNVEPAFAHLKRKTS